MDELDKLFAVSATSEPQPPQRIKPAVVLSDALTELPISLLIDYPKDKDPFRAYSDAEMNDLMEDIRVNGVLQPAIVRPHPSEQSKYEIISGHHRRTAAASLGYTTLPCIIRDIDDDTAVCQMIATNMKQRTGMLPSEKAWAYRYQLEAMKHQGYRSDLYEIDKETDEAEPDTKRQMRRYIRLTYLVPRLLKYVDSGKLPLVSAVELSYLTPEDQSIVLHFFFEIHSIPITLPIAQKLRALDGHGLSPDMLEQLYCPLAAVPTVKSTKSIKIPTKRLTNYFPAATTVSEVVETIDKALKLYFDNNDNS